MKNILAVIDMQNDFITGPLSTERSLTAAENTARKINRFHGDIFLTLDTHFDDYENTNQGRAVPVRHCISGSEGQSLYPDIVNALQGKKYEIIRKSAYGSFALAAKISEHVQNDTFSLEIVGVCTDICVISNALILKTFFPRANISVVADCCAATSKDAHFAALTVMRSCQIEII